MKPSQDAIDLDASLNLVRAALGTPLELLALREHVRLVANIKAKAVRTAGSEVQWKPRTEAT